MWLHIGVFIIVAVLAVGVKVGWIPAENAGTKKGRRLFLTVALLGNLAGMLLTVLHGGGQVCSEDYRLEKEEILMRRNSWYPWMENEAGSLYVQIPEKEVESEEELQPKELTAEELQKQEMLELVEKYNLEKEDPDYYYLPGSWKGQNLTWTTPKDNTGNMMAALALLAAFSMIVFTAREEQKIRQKRYEALMMEYPGMVMKFTLLVQAGMTVRNAFVKMAADYKKKKDKKLAYEEIMTACCEMESGVSEAEVYRRFGERCGHVKYKTFATLLVQNPAERKPTYGRNAGKRICGSLG